MLMFLLKQTIQCTAIANNTEKQTALLELSAEVPSRYIYTPEECDNFRIATPSFFFDEASAWILPMSDMIQLGL